MKKLFALMAAGGLLALTTGCPPAPSTGTTGATHATPGTSAGTHGTTPADHGKTDHATPETKPEVKPETKPEVKPETKPEVKPETKPETKPEVKPETKPETKPDATKTETGKVEKGALMVDGKEVKVPASVKDELKNIKDGSDVTVTLDKDGKVTKVEEKK